MTLKLVFNASMLDAERQADKFTHALGKTLYEREM